MKLFVVLLITCLVTVSACDHLNHDAEPKSTASSNYDLQSDSTVYTKEMKRFWLVELRKGPNRNQDSVSRVKIQAAHISNIERLAKEGKIIMAGPIGVEDDLQGIFLMNCSDSTEVEKFVQTDTAVITGRLVMNYYPWWTAKGKFIFK
jgi:uncharacterized protein YciI